MPTITTTEDNPGGVPISVFDEIRAGFVADRSQRAAQQSEEVGLVKRRRNRRAARPGLHDVRGRLP